MTNNLRSNWRRWSESDCADSQSKEPLTRDNIRAQRNVVSAVFAPLDKGDATVSGLITDKVTIAPSVRSKTSRLISSRRLPITRMSIERERHVGLIEGQLLREKRRRGIDLEGVEFPRTRPNHASREGEEYHSKGDWKWFAHNRVF